MTNEPLLNKRFVSINDTSLHTDKRQGFTGYMLFFIYASGYIQSFLMGRDDHQDRCFFPFAVSSLLSLSTTTRPDFSNQGQQIKKFSSITQIQMPMRDMKAGRRSLEDSSSWGRPWRGDHPERVWRQLMQAAASLDTLPALRDWDVHKHRQLFLPCRTKGPHWIYGLLGPGPCLHKQSPLTILFLNLMRTAWKSLHLCCPWTAVPESTIAKKGGTLYFLA